MNEILTPLQVIIAATAGWLNRQQADVIDFLIEQSRVLLELHDGKCHRLSDHPKISTAAAVTEPPRGQFSPQPRLDARATN